MNEIVFQPIGVIHSPFQTPLNMPVQPSAAEGIQGSAEIFPPYQEGLQDLDGFSHIYLLYYLHLSEGYDLKVIPFLDDAIRGVFSTRAPRRPNAIGLSVVKLIRITQNIVEIENVDIVDGTPLLDIKPYVPEMDAPEKCTIGWLEKHRTKIRHAKSDKRFTL